MFQDHCHEISSTDAPHQARPLIIRRRRRLQHLHRRRVWRGTIRTSHSSCHPKSPPSLPRQSVPMFTKDNNKRLDQEEALPSPTSTRKTAPTKTATAGEEAWASVAESISPPARQTVSIQIYSGIVFNNFNSLLLLF